MITLASATLEAHILPRGATLAGLWIKGIARSLVLGFAQETSFSSCPIYAGALVGPVANRITKGQVRIGSDVFRMPANEGPTCLHSGDHGVHARDWQITDQTKSGVTLRVALANGAIGLPGLRHLTAQYALLADRTLALTITASSDRDTVMNIAHHPYWSLDDRCDVSGHKLKIAAKNYLPVTRQGLPTGHIALVNGIDYDFRNTRTIPVDRVLDANLCLSNTRCATPRSVAVLTGSTGIQMEILTTEPGLQVYNAAGLPTNAPPALPGQTIGPFAGIALEPQGWPDAPENPRFAQIFLAANTGYRQQTRYRFS